MLCVFCRYSGTGVGPACVVRLDGIPTMSTEPILPKEGLHSVGLLQDTTWDVVGHR